MNQFEKHLSSLNVGSVVTVAFRNRKPQKWIVSRQVVTCGCNGRVSKSELTLICHAPIKLKNKCSTT